MVKTGSASHHRRWALALAALALLAACVHADDASDRAAPDALAKQPAAAEGAEAPQAEAKGNGDGSGRGDGVAGAGSGNGPGLTDTDRDGTILVLNQRNARLRTPQHVIIRARHVPTPEEVEGARAAG